MTENSHFSYVKGNLFGIETAENLMSAAPMNRIIRIVEVTDRKNYRAF